MARAGDPDDPGGLIAEAYRIAGISEAECRTIFLDWAMAAPGDAAPLIEGLLARHAPQAPGHPMTRILREGLRPAPPPSRRGGRAARRR